MSEAVVRARPYRARVMCWVCAPLVVLVFAAVAVSLGGGEGSLSFGVGDQIAMAGLGVVLAGAVLLFTRPAVEADAHGVSVRNLIADKRVPWELVVAVRFDDHAPWAALELAGDELVPMMAIQRVDRERAVRAVRGVRRLLAASRDGGDASGRDVGDELGDPDGGVL